MGTQQILLIVLSVIIVGVAIAVGITMFNTQAYNSNRSAIASECTSFATNVVQWWKTPIAQGGGGQDPTKIDTLAINNYTGLPLTSDSGSFQINGFVNTAGSETVTIVGIGKEKKGSVFPKVTTVVTLATGGIVSTPSTATSATDW
jgi:hypothetical protein